MNEDYKMVIIVRKDIKLGPGKMAAQVGHAAVNCALSAKKNHKKFFDEWYDQGQKKVVVKVQDLEELESLRERARSQGLVHHLVTDAGMTEVPPGTVTCLGVGPGPANLVDSVTGGLTLW